MVISLIFLLANEDEVRQIIEHDCIACVPNVASNYSILDILRNTFVEVNVRITDVSPPRQLSTNGNISD